MKRLKLIWDFRGIDALETAKHHEVHLNEFIKKDKLESSEAGYEEITDVHTIAFIIVLEKDMIAVRDALLPQRGEYV